MLKPLFLVIVEISCQISLLHFFHESARAVLWFFTCFHFGLNFLKVLGFCQTWFTISARSLWIFFLFLHLCQVLELSFSDQRQNIHSLIPCWFLKYYSPASSLSSWAGILSSYSCSDSSPPDRFWNSFLLSALPLEELILIFCFLFLCLTCSSKSFFESDGSSELALPSSHCLSFLNFSPLASALEVWKEVFLLFYQSDSQTWT